MPIYEYVPDSGDCERCGGRFEVLHKAGEEPLTSCPECGEACHRVLSSFGVQSGTGALLSPKNLEAKGFTQYKRSGKGAYEKTAGKQGPNIIRRPD